MEIEKTVQTTTITRIRFSEEQIIDALFKASGIEKTWQNECEFDIGETLRGATITIRKVETVDG